RQRRRAAVLAGVGGGSFRLPRVVSQLVERAPNVGEGAGDRSGRLARLMDGEFPLDETAGRPSAGDATTDGRPRARPGARPRRDARVHRRWQLRWTLSTSG